MGRLRSGPVVMNRVCVFAGSSSGARSQYGDAARKLGAALISRNLGLVYGGGAVGLMGLLGRGLNFAGCFDALASSWAAANGASAATAARLEMSCVGICIDLLERKRRVLTTNPKQSPAGWPRRSTPPRNNLHTLFSMLAAQVSGMMCVNVL